jgi:outer membrane protein insertion porin family
LLIKIQEGGQYKFSGFKLTGHLILPRKQLRNLVTIKPNTIFSKSEVVNAETAIGDALGSKGYAKAKVTTKPQVNEKTKRVFLVFDVQPGPHVYVRFINFQGNNSTNDEAFRRVLTQMEGGLVSTTALKNSKQRLLQLPFVRNVELTTTPVRGKPNEEDLNYKVTTVPAGKIQAGVGYSDVDGAMINAGISQQNIFGTGNSFNISTSYSASMLSAQVGYFNPYYTQWGVGRGFNIYASHYDASEANIADYATDNYGGAVTYSIPMTLHTSVQFSLGLDDLYLQPASDPSEEIDSFVTKHGKSFLQIPVNFGVTYNDLNRTVFPTAGFVQTGGVAVSVPVDSKSLEYYKLTYNAQYYQPIYKSFIAHFKVGGGYGGGYGDYDKLPFFKNFYAGGMGTVRGYAANTIGPQDSQGNSIGGNLLYYASAGLVFPNPFSKTLRTTWFFDAGNVINTKATRAERARNPDRNAVRMSTGVEFDWLSPMGMLNFSLAKALNANSQDDTQVFQFNIGTVF